MQVAKQDTARLEDPMKDEATKEAVKSQNGDAGPSSPALFLCPYTRIYPFCAPVMGLALYLALDVGTGHAILTLLGLGCGTLHTDSNATVCPHLLALALVAVGTRGNPRASPKNLEWV